VAVEQLPRPQVIFFDLFGTIFEWSKPPRRAISEALAAHGHPVDPEDVNRARLEVERRLPTRDEHPAEDEAHYWRHFDGDLLQKLGVPTSPSLLAAIRDEFDAKVRLTLQSDAPAALQALRDYGARLGVISNSTFGMRRDLLRLGAERYFDHIVFSQPLNARKPDPHIFLVALSKFACPPTSAWMVGDDPSTDIKGARGVGMVPVLIDRAGRYPDTTATRISDLRQVPELYAAAVA
jgi:HAD superfamily hydrolase (TIGR01549 family)